MKKKVRFILSENSNIKIDQEDRDIVDIYDASTYEILMLDISAELMDIKQSTISEFDKLRELTKALNFA